MGTGPDASLLRSTTGLRGRRLDRDLGPPRRPTPRSRSRDISAEMASPSGSAEAAVKFDKCAATRLINIPSRSQPAISGQTGRWISWLQREFQRRLRAAAAVGAPAHIQGSRNAEKRRPGVRQRSPTKSRRSWRFSRPVCRRLGYQPPANVGSGGPGPEPSRGSLRGSWIASALGCLGSRVHRRGARRAGSVRMPCRR
jgi:hypothetical protein